MAVLIVVVLDEVVELVGGFGRVVNQAATIDRLEAGGIGVVHAKAFEREAPRVCVPHEIEQPANRVLVALNPRKRAVRFARRRRELAVLGTDVEFAVQVEAPPVAHFSSNTGDLRGGRQAVVKDDFARIELILDIASSPRHHQKLRDANAAVLPVGGHFDPVVVGQHEAEAHVFDAGDGVVGLVQPQIQPALQGQAQGALLAFALFGSQRVLQHNALRPIGPQESTALLPTLYHRRKANAAAREGGVLKDHPHAAFDRHLAPERRGDLHLRAEQHRPTLAVCGRIVGQPHDQLVEPST